MSVFVGRSFLIVMRLRRAPKTQPCAAAARIAIIKVGSRPSELRIKREGLKIFSCDKLEEAGPADTGLMCFLNPLNEISSKRLVRGAHLCEEKCGSSDKEDNLLRAVQYSGLKRSPRSQIKATLANADSTLYVLDEI